MDYVRSRAVIEAFVRLYDEGLIYRRSNDTVELLLKPQWYVDCTSMVNDALDAVLDEGNRKIEVLPKRYEAEWKRGFENSQDYCISSQLSWGHRVPAWYVTFKDAKLKELGAYSDRWVVCRSVEDAQAEAQRSYNGKDYMIAQDPDVLDTWFSSAILPLSVLGWPDKTDDLKVFYPTSVLVTGHDTLFSWVAPMVMLCSKLGGDVPFRKLYLHHLINDRSGHKISKASGNIVDPLDFIGGISNDNLNKKLLDDGLSEEQIKNHFPSEVLPFGADSFRYGLIVSKDQSGDIKFNIKDFISYYRGSCLVVWETARMAMSILGDNYLPPTRINPSVMPFSCQWILSVLNRTVEKNDASLVSLELSQAAITVRSWWQNELSTFITLTQSYAAGKACASERDYDSAWATLWVCLDAGLRLLHIFMPYVTEELWQRLPQARDTLRKESIMISRYPSPVQSWTSESVEREMVVVCAFADFIKPNRIVFARREVFLFSPDEGKLDIIRRRKKEIEVLSNISGVEVLKDINDVTPEYRSTSD